ncbi:MAG: hypothetical protein ACYC1L_16560 [Alphaproteobacteria bacterium]
MKRNERSSKGPDIAISNGRNTIWIEAIAPTPGTEGHADRVPEVRSISESRERVLQTIPEEKILLRYTAAISEKFNKHAGYIKDGTIKPNEPYVIAISSRKLGFWGDSNPPKILKAVYPFGDAYFTMDRKSGEIIDSGFHRRDSVKKANSREIFTNSFLDKTWAPISGLIFSRSDPWNRHYCGPDHFLFAHNFVASTPLPKKYFPFGREYEALEDAEHHKIVLV